MPLPQHNPRTTEPPEKARTGPPASEEWLTRQLDAAESSRRYFEAIEAYRDKHERGPR